MSNISKSKFINFIMTSKKYLNDEVRFMSEYNLGIDIGSTTVKVVVLDKNKNIILEEEDV